MDPLVRLLGTRPGASAQDAGTPVRPVRCGRPKSRTEVDGDEERGSSRPQAAGESPRTFDHILDASLKASGSHAISGHAPAGSSRASHGDGDGRNRRLSGAAESSDRAGSRASAPSADRGAAPNHDTGNAAKKGERSDPATGETRRVAGTLTTGGLNESDRRPPDRPTPPSFEKHAPIPTGVDVVREKRIEALVARSSSANASTSEGRETIVGSPMNPPIATESKEREGKGDDPKGDARARFQDRVRHEAPRPRASHGGSSAVDARGPRGAGSKASVLADSRAAGASDSSVDRHSARWESSSGHDSEPLDRGDTSRTSERTSRNPAAGHGGFDVASTKGGGARNPLKGVPALEEAQAPQRGGNLDRDGGNAERTGNGRAGSVVSSSGRRSFARDVPVEGSPGPAGVAPNGDSPDRSREVRLGPSLVITQLADAGTTESRRAPDFFQTRSTGLVARSRLIGRSETSASLLRGPAGTSVETEQGTAERRPSGVASAEGVGRAHAEGLPARVEALSTEPGRPTTHAVESLDENPHVSTAKIDSARDGTGHPAGDVGHRSSWSIDSPDGISQTGSRQTALAVSARGQSSDPLRNGSAPATVPQHPSLTADPGASTSRTSQSGTAIVDIHESRSTAPAGTQASGPEARQRGVEDEPAAVERTATSRGREGDFESSKVAALTASASFPSRTQGAWLAADTRPDGLPPPPPVVHSLARLVLENAGRSEHVNPSLSLRLDHEDLGSIDIALRRGRGGLVIELSAQRTETMHLLAGSSSTLVQEIRSAGVDLESVTVGSGSPQGSSDQGQGTQSGPYGDPQASAGPESRVGLMIPSLPDRLVTMSASRRVPSGLNLLA